MLIVVAVTYVIQVIRYNERYSFHFILTFLLLQCCLSQYFNKEIDDDDDDGFIEVMFCTSINIHLQFHR